VQRTIDLQGSELVEEWRALQAEATTALCLEWLDRYSEVIAQARPGLSRARPAITAGAVQLILSWITSVP